MAADDDEMRRRARNHGLDFVNLDETAIPSSVLQLIPISVVCENAVLPLDEDGGTLRVVMSDPLDYDTREKLIFILNRNIEIVLAPHAKILEAIDKYYS